MSFPLSSHYFIEFLPLLHDGVCLAFETEDGQVALLSRFFVSAFQEEVFLPLNLDLPLSLDLEGVLHLHHLVSQFSEEVEFLHECDADVLPAQ